MKFYIETISYDGYKYDRVLKKYPYLAEFNPERVQCKYDRKRTVEIQEKIQIEFETLDDLKRFVEAINSNDYISGVVINKTFDTILIYDGYIE